MAHLIKDRKDQQLAKIITSKINARMRKTGLEIALAVGSGPKIGGFSRGIQ